jgi:hypothetical protein
VLLDRRVERIHVDVKNPTEHGREMQLPVLATIAVVAALGP